MIRDASSSTELLGELVLSASDGGGEGRGCREDIAGIILTSTFVINLEVYKMQ